MCYILYIRTQPLIGVDDGLMGAFSSGYLLSSMTPQCHPFGGHRLIYTRAR